MQTKTWAAQQVTGEFWLGPGVIVLHLPEIMSLAWPQVSPSVSPFSSNLASGQQEKVQCAEGEGEGGEGKKQGGKERKSLNIV